MGQSTYLDCLEIVFQLRGEFRFVPAVTPQLLTDIGDAPHPLHCERCVLTGSRVFATS